MVSEGRAEEEKCGRINGRSFKPARVTVGRVAGACVIRSVCWKRTLANVDVDGRWQLTLLQLVLIVVLW